MNLIKRVIKDSLTTSNGEDYDVGRILWVLSVLDGIAYAGVDLFILKSPFNIVNYGIGIGSLLAAGGAALWAKRDTEAK